AAFSRIAVATASHFFSWSGVILSDALSETMRCSTVSGLLLVAAAAAGGFCSAVCAIAGPASSAAPISEAMARDRRTGWLMRRLDMEFLPELDSREAPNLGESRAGLSGLTSLERKGYGRTLADRRGIFRIASRPSSRRRSMRKKTRQRRGT